MATIFSSVGVKQQLGKRIRLLRNDRGWSQEVLAELAGLHRNYIGHVERVEVNAGLVNLEKIAQAFEISVHELLNMDNLAATARDGGSTGKAGAVSSDPPRTEEPARQVYKLDLTDYWKSPPPLVSRAQRK